MTLATPTPSDVKAIYPDCSIGDQQVQTIIDDTAELLNDCTVIQNATAARQKIIVKLVAAHLISMSQGKSGVLTSKALGDASEGYGAIPLGKGLNATVFGQQALMYEPTGCLARIGLKPVIFLAV